MNRRVLHFFSMLSLLFVVGLSVCAEEAKMLMWKVTSDDGGVVYLLGSIHAMKKETYPLPPEMEKAFTDSKFLVLEADESKTDPLKMQQMVMSKGMYTGDDVLSKHISQATQDKMKEVLPKQGIQPAMLEKTKPWMASVMISMTGLMKMGFDPQMGIDKHFLNEANEGKKTVLELESAEFQLNLLASFSDELQEKFLLSTLMESDGMEENMKKMVEAWTAGDADGMDKEINKQLAKAPELKPVFEKLFYERNNGMTSKVEEYLKTKESHFVIAGAGHMVGEKGIVAQLKGKKFKVEQVTKAK